jgi:hypothetical protein
METERPVPAFVSFLREHCDAAYFALLGFQLQPLDPSLHCSVIHVVAAVNGKGTPDAIATLFSLRKLFEKNWISTFPDWRLTAIRGLISLMIGSIVHGQLM